MKVSLDHGLVPALAECQYKLYYGFGKVKFQKPMPPSDKSKKGRKEVEGHTSPWHNMDKRVHSIYTL